MVDSADVHRLRDCAVELGSLLLEEKLTGASLLIFANKQDLAGALTVQQISEVRPCHLWRITAPPSAWLSFQTIFKRQSDHFRGRSKILYKSFERSNR